MAASKLPSKPPQVAFIKHTELYRTHFPLNKCGSKQLIVAMDPSLDFETVITIGQPGWSGVRLSKHSFLVMMDSSDMINHFFKTGESMLKNNTFALSATEKLEFRSQWGKPMLVLSSSVEGGASITLAKVTWEGLLKLRSHILHTEELVSQAQGDVFHMFLQIVAAVKLRLPTEESNVSPNTDKMEVISQIIQSLTFKDIEDISLGKSHHFESHPITGFYELQSYCKAEIAGNLHCA